MSKEGHLYLISNYKKIFKKWIKKKKLNRNLLPINGIAAVSALATTVGDPFKSMIIESTNVECDATTSIGASLAVACAPRTFK